MNFLILIPLLIQLLDGSSINSHLREGHHNVNAHANVHSTQSNSLPPADYKMDRPFYPENLLFCKDDFCSKVFEMSLSNNNKFQCKEHNIEVYAKYKNKHNQTIEEMGYLTLNNNISDIQSEGKCLHIRNYKINNELSILVMDKNYQFVKSKDLNEIINSNLRHSHWVTWFFFNIDYYDVRTDSYLIFRLYSDLSAVLANVFLILFVFFKLFEKYIWIKLVNYLKAIVMSLINTVLIECGKAADSAKKSSLNNASELQSKETLIEDKHGKRAYRKRIN